MRRAYKHHPPLLPRTWIHRKLSTRIIDVVPHFSRRHISPASVSSDLGHPSHRLTTQLVAGASPTSRSPHHHLFTSTGTVRPFPSAARLRLTPSPATGPRATAARRCHSHRWLQPPVSPYGRNQGGRWCSHAASPAHAPVNSLRQRWFASGGRRRSSVGRAASESACGARPAAAELEEAVEL